MSSRKAGRGERGGGRPAARASAAARQGGDALDCAAVQLEPERAARSSRAGEKEEEVRRRRARRRRRACARGRPRLACSPVSHPVNPLVNNGQSQPALHHYSLQHRQPHHNTPSPAAALVRLPSANLSTTSTRRTPRPAPAIRTAERPACSTTATACGTRAARGDGRAGHGREVGELRAMHGSAAARVCARACWAA